MESKNYAIALVAILAVGAICYLIYMLGASLMVNENGGPQSQELLLNALAKQATQRTYTYDYVENVDGMVTSYHLVEAPDFFVIQSKNVFYGKTAYYNSSGEVLCISFGGKESCSKSADDADLNGSVSTAKVLLLSRNGAANLRKINMSIGLGAITFPGEPVKSQVNGNECELVTYTRDYSKLTLQNLNDLGIAANSADVLLVKNFTSKVCIDSASNFLSFEYDYIYSGQARKTNVTVLRNGWGIASRSELTYPALADANATKGLFIEALSARSTVLACEQNPSSADACVKNYAVNSQLPDLCLMAGAGKDGCIIISAPPLLRADLCGKVDNSSLRDSCWVEIAARTGNASFCNNVADQGNKTKCLALANNASLGNQTGANQTTNMECSTGADCFAAGCSGQLCVPEGQKGTITTCELRPEYACLKLTQCGCVQGKCAWEQNSEYAGCLQNLTNSSG